MTRKDHPGATFEEWMHFSQRLKLQSDLLPCVGNPAAQISPNSKMKGLGKTPSRYNNDHMVVGIADWPQINADAKDISRWSKENDYSICVQTRLIRGLDIDVPDAATSAAIEAAARAAVPGVHFPKRFRANSGKCLLAFSFDGELTKRAFPVDGGIVELLATGQQFIACGTHFDRSGPSGVRYLWDDGLPEAFPILDKEELEALWSALELCFATGETTVGKVSVRETGSSTGEGMDTQDDVAAYLTDQGLVLDVSPSGQLYVECPWKDGHSSDNGPSETGYFPAGTGGFDLGHWKCLHTSCAHRTDNDFLDALGFSLDTEFRARDFEDLDEGLPARLPSIPDLTQDNEGRPLRVFDKRTLPAYDQVFKRASAGIDRGTILVTQDNVSRAVECAEFITRKLRWDAFNGETVWAWYDEADTAELWQSWSDADSTKLRRMLDMRGFKTSPSIEMIRGAVYEVSQDKKIDTAMAWLNGLQWDGVERCESFLVDYLGGEDTPYVRAVSRYMWTAMAGRALVPGVQADMAVILVTEEQGKGKTSMIRALVPHEEWFGELDLHKDEDDLARIMRGKLVCELSELKGLAGRESGSIKSFISRRKEEWVPKYQEKSQPYLRRVFLIGTTNETEFLADVTGERRWLPLHIGRAEIAAIRRDCLQLWAEARERFELLGIEYDDAERLATAEHHKFKTYDALEDKIGAWALEEGLGGHVPAENGFTLEEMAEQCLDQKIADVRKVDQMRYGRILQTLGYHKARVRRGSSLCMVWKMEKTNG